MVLHNSKSPLPSASLPPAPGCFLHRASSYPHKYASQMFPLLSQVCLEFHLYYRCLLFHFNGLPLFSRRRKTLAFSTLINYHPLPSPRPRGYQVRTHFNGLDRRPGFICHSVSKQSVMCGLRMNFMLDSNINRNRTDGPRFAEI